MEYVQGDQVHPTEEHGELQSRSGRGAGVRGGRADGQQQRVVGLGLGFSLGFCLGNQAAGAHTEFSSAAR